MRVTRKGFWLLLGLLLLWGVAGHIFYRVDRQQDLAGYALLSELIAQKAKLAQTISGPRVVIAGGSNAYYGLDAKVLQDELGVAVVNLALPFGAHHYAIALDLLEKQVRPGDTVVFSSAGFWNLRVTTKRHALEFDAFLDKDLDWYSRKFVDSPFPWRPLPESGPLLLAIATGFETSHERSWIDDTDALGNYIACVDSPVVLPERYVHDDAEPALIKALLRTGKRLQAKNVKLTISIPWLLIRESDRESWMRFQDRLVEQLGSSLDVLASKPDMLLRLSQKDFCDSPLHLSTEASRQRSLSLAEALQPVIGSR